MTEDVLQAVLTQEQREAGLYLEEPDDHTVELKDKAGERLAAFNSVSATVVAIRREGDRHIGRLDVNNALEQMSSLDGNITPELDGRMNLLAELAAWIDTQVIAEMIIDHLEEQGGEITLERAKQVWLNTLQNLGGGVGLGV